MINLFKIELNQWVINKQLVVMKFMELKIIIIMKNNFGVLLKDFAINLTLKAAEKAKEFKNITEEYLNKLQNEYEN